MDTKRDIEMMRFAHEVSKHALCPRKDVGCVISTIRGYAVSSANGAPPGSPSCKEVGCRLVKVDGVETCTRVVHSERNCVFEAAKLGIKLDNATLYVTLFPCLACTQAIVCSGISRVVYRDMYKPDINVLDLLENAKVTLSMFSNGTIVPDVLQTLRRDIDNGVYAAKMVT